MSSCCTPRGYRRVFSARSAERQARRYRSRGLDRTSRRIAAALLARGVEGATVLEAGGGVGALQVELLRAGALHAVSVELTPTYEHAATALLRDFQLSDRVERRIGDLVSADGAAAPADIVVLNRVLCCYPDMPRLAMAAAQRTARILVLSFPKRTWWTVALLHLGNALLRIGRGEFQVFVHDPRSIRRVVEAGGLHQTRDERGLFWEVMAFEAGGRG